MNKIPNVVLIGRMNVGKSTLFNRISKRTTPLTLDYEGVTRDFIKEKILWKGIQFSLVDTGGVSLKKINDPILEQVRQQALELAQNADVVLLMIDASVGLLTEELALAKKLHKSKASVIVVANKVDKKVAQEHLEECRRLGFDHVIPVSAVHNEGVTALLDETVELLPRQKIEPGSGKKERSCRVALLGKPNVGKSSLMNLLLKKDRSIVTDVAGTTREAVREEVQFYSQTIELTDTAGVRRKKKVEDELEGMMVKSSMQAVRTSDIVLLLIDAQEGRLTDQELKLAFYAFEQGKALIILVNKADLLDAHIKAQWEYHNEEYEFFYKKIDHLTISCKDGKNIGKIFPLVMGVWKRYLSEFSVDELTSLLKQSLIRRPLYKQEHVLKVNAAKQVKSGPPTIKLFVGLPQFFGDRELAYFERVLRREYDLKSVPVKFLLEKGKRASD